MDASTSWGIGFVMDGKWLAWELVDSWHGDDRDIGWAEMVAVELGIHALIAAGKQSTHFSFIQIPVLSVPCASPCLVTTNRTTFSARSYSYAMKSGLLHHRLNIR